MVAARSLSIVRNANDGTLRDLQQRQVCLHRRRPIASLQCFEVFNDFAEELSDYRPLQLLKWISTRRPQVCAAILINDAPFSRSSSILSGSGFIKLLHPSNPMTVNPSSTSIHQSLYCCSAGASPPPLTLQLWLRHRIFCFRLGRFISYHILMNPMSDATMGSVQKEELFG